MSCDFWRKQERAKRAKDSKQASARRSEDASVDKLLLPPTEKQQRILDRFGLTAATRLDASNQISRLAKNGWRKPTTTGE